MSRVAENHLTHHRRQPRAPRPRQAPGERLAAYGDIAAIHGESPPRRRSISPRLPSILATNGLISGAPQFGDPGYAPADRYQSHEREWPVAKGAAGERRDRTPDRNHYYRESAARNQRCDCHCCGAGSMGSVHRFHLHAAQHESFDTSRVNDWAASFRPSDMVRYRELSCRQHARRPDPASGRRLSLSS